MVDDWRHSSTFTLSLTKLGPRCSWAPNCFKRSSCCLPVAQSAVVGACICGCTSVSVRNNERKLELTDTSKAFMSYSALI
ncbi:hypothetical protein BV25DRAFT_120491 [Artomyces pyxidatus]|uniref:Uncharacterized protein n=1 Tax=Artomyces pyxidatus TaxID=48021 RepID=A0ACB8TLL8_9AGAM|nr:hypothetical protein BV25DRAFT_120491 [Artomyces pyxidatus]